MTHCTVCGAAAREGARFCTSCGARLVDSVATRPPEPEDPPASDRPVDEPASDATETPASEPEPSSSWTSVSPDPAGTEEDTPPPEAVDASIADAPAASWPDANGEPASVDAPPPATDEPVASTDADPAWPSWDGAPDEEEADTIMPASDPDLPVDGDRQAASGWTGWAPVPLADEIATNAPEDDPGASIRGVLNDLAARIDRLIDPATVARRGVDADELADQLDRWSQTAAGGSDLLEVVRAVRTSPRDVDALTRLADRAPDLELLVRHYQAIAVSSGDWARKLREQDTASTSTD